jgi:hypothetical protein
MGTQKNFCIFNDSTLLILGGGQIKYTAVMEAQASMGHISEISFV